MALISTEKQSLGQSLAANSLLHSWMACFAREVYTSYSSLEGPTVLPFTQNLPQAQELRSLFSWLCVGTSISPESLRGPKPGLYLNKWRRKLRRVRSLLRMTIWPNHLLPIKSHPASFLLDLTESQQPWGSSVSSWSLPTASNALDVHTALLYVSAAWVLCSTAECRQPCGAKP